MDGFTGGAGLMRFQWPSRAVDYRFYDGVSGGHNVSLSPDGRRLLLGNLSQQFVVVDSRTLEVLRRAPTLGIEESDYRLRANTHHLWTGEQTFIAAIGDHLYEIDLDRLHQPKKLGAHRLWTAHELRWSHDKRFILTGDLGPERAGARQIGIFDRQKPSDAQVVKLPGTCWHTCTHPTKNLGYAATYSVAGEEDNDYIHWTPAFVREYVFEVDLEQAVVTRVFSSGADFPIHLNSDIDLYEDKLYVAAGGSHAVVELDLGDFTTTRAVTVVPGPWSRLKSFRQGYRNFIGGLMRKSFYLGTHLLVQTYMVSGGRTFDGVYAARVSPDGRYLCAGNRGYNYLRVMDRATLRTVYEADLPKLPGGLHIGLHHSEMLAGGT
jgi:hypothetical protein